MQNLRNRTRTPAGLTATAGRLYALHRRQALALIMLMTATAGSGVQAAQTSTRFPGFGLSLSRVVVAADDRSSGQVYAVNNSENVYLVQTRVWAAEGVTGYAVADKPGTPRVAVPLMVTPPLKRIERNGVLPLRIIATQQVSALPADRESLFFLSSKAIPSQARAPDNAADGKKAGGKASGQDVGERGASLSLALQSYIKVFYRPSGLGAHAIFDGGVADKLTFSRRGDRVTVTNPTPYHITFGLLAVAGRQVDADSRRVMVPPKGTQEYPVPAGTPAGEVTWQVIDEFGLMTDLKRQPLS